MMAQTVQELDQHYIADTYARFPVVLRHGKGSLVYDENEREYIDLATGIAVNTFGYADDSWQAAVTAQLGTLQHTSNLYYNPVQAQFADELCRAAGMSRAFLCNSGAEANECAIKLARKYSFDHYGEGRATIVTLVNSFHGRTVTTLAATGQDGFHRYFDPFTGGFRYAEAGDIGALEEALDSTVCAVLLECVQGEGGVIALEPAYLQAVAALCAEHDVLLMTDEVQTGVGRTGKFLAIEHAGVKPDVVTLAKGLGGGLPIGACLCSEELKDVMSAGMHGSTFGGNPVVCAGGRVVLETVTQPGFLEAVAEKGEYLRRRLAEMPHVQEVRGLGMMLGVRLDDALTARAVAEACVEGGLLILTAKTLLRLLPPLNITREEMDKGLAVLENVLKGWNNA